MIIVPEASSCTLRRKLCFAIAYNSSVLHYPRAAMILCIPAALSIFSSSTFTVPFSFHSSLLPPFPLFKYLTLLFSFSKQSVTPALSLHHVTSMQLSFSIAPTFIFFTCSWSFLFSFCNITFFFCWQSVTPVVL